MKSLFAKMAVATSLGLGMISVQLPAHADTKVGLILPYTGTYAALGNAITDGFNMAIEEAGRTDEFSIVTEDTEAKPPVGLAKARKNASATSSVRSIRSPWNP